MHITLFKLKCLGKAVHSQSGLGSLSKTTRHSVIDQYKPRYGQMDVLLEYLPSRVRRYCASVSAWGDDSWRRAAVTSCRSCVMVTTGCRQTSCNSHSTCLSRVRSDKGRSGTVVFFNHAVCVVMLHAWGSKVLVRFFHIRPTKCWTKRCFGPKKEAACAICDYHVHKGR